MVVWLLSSQVKLRITTVHLVALKLSFKPPVAYERVNQCLIVKKIATKLAMVFSSKALQEMATLRVPHSRLKTKTSATLKTSVPAPSGLVPL